MSASTNAYGSFQYSQSFAYNQIGNITNNSGIGYYYGAANRHAVRTLIGSGGTNKTVVIVAKSSATGTVPQMRLRVNGAWVADWNVEATSYTNYTTTVAPLTGNDVLEVGFINDDGSRDLYVDEVIVDGTTFEADGGAMIFDQGNGNDMYDGLNVSLQINKTLAQGGALRFVKGSSARNAGYDPNGNMTSRLEEGKAYVYTYDVENHLSTVTGYPTPTATFAYDGDGVRVKGVVSGTTTYYVGNHWEVGPTAWAKYYYFAGMRIAVRDGSGVTYIHSDQLGSATNTTGQNVSGEMYYPYGGKRSTNPAYTPYRFTGQREESTIGLYFYQARWYDPVLSRFIQADTIVPQPADPQSLNRYSYVRNNPIRHVDPTGHMIPEEHRDELRSETTGLLVAELASLWDTCVVGEYHNWELRILAKGVRALGFEMGGPSAFRQQVGRLEFVLQEHVTFFLQPHKDLGGLTLAYGPIRMSRMYLSDWTVVHEIAHRWDFNTAGALSRGFMSTVGATDKLPWAVAMVMDMLGWRPAGTYDKGPHVAAQGGNPENPFEDFADSVAAYIYSTRNFIPLSSERSFRDTPRGQAIAALMTQLK